LLVQRSTVAAKIFFESARLALALRYLNANEACRPVQAPQASPEHEAPLALVNMWRINQDDAVAAACTSRYQLWVCVRGRSPAGYHFYFFVLIPTSTGDWKLAQEGSNFARQRNSTIFFVASSGSLFRCRPLVCAKGDLQVCRHHPLCGNLGKVLRLPATLPLDGARA
jgi:hypothetical protein